MLKIISQLMRSDLKDFPLPVISFIGFLGLALGWQISLLLPLLPSRLWPGGIGIGEDDSVTTKTVETSEKDEQGKTVKNVTTTAHSDGKTLWDWLSLLGVPLSLAILGYVLQEQQRERADNETKEEVLQNYLDRLSLLLIDGNLIWLSKKSNSSIVTPIITPITPEEQELLDSALDVIRARTLSILRRFKNDTERKTSVIRFLIETEIVSKSKLNLSGADLSGADLSGADLEGAILQEANLQGANLQGANPIEAEFQEANLQEAKLQGAKLQGANPIEAEFQEANLQEAKLQGAKLQGANLTEANLQGANLIKANLQGAKFREAKLQGANLTKANFIEAELQGAELQGANLTEANLQGANLTKANLTKANLQGANLSGAILEGADLSGADLKDIKSKWNLAWKSETIWPDKSAFTDAKNIPPDLKKELGITP